MTTPPTSPYLADPARTVAYPDAAAAAAAQQSCVALEVAAAIVASPAHRAMTTSVLTAALTAVSGPYPM